MCLYFWQLFRLRQISAIFGSWIVIRCSKLSHVIMVWRTDRTSEGLKRKWRHYTPGWYYSSCFPMELGDQRGSAQEHCDHLDQSVYRNESVSDVSKSFTICTDADALWVVCYIIVCVYIWGRHSNTLTHTRLQIHILNQQKGFFWVG